MFPVAIISIVVFPPWDGISAWLAPLPDTVQEQVDAAIDHGPTIGDTHYFILISTIFVKKGVKF
jgi:hypothetical protein